MIARTPRRGGALGALAVLWRHKLFRRLLAVRIATQTADGVLQMGTATHVLLSPADQPDAWSIAAVLAITLLPFSAVGPFISSALDRWPRQRTVWFSDCARTIIALAVAWTLITGWSADANNGALLALVLVAMSLNRFVMAGLNAGVAHTVSPREYLAASSVMPVIGPAGVMVGAVVAGAVRLTLSGRLGADTADAVVFALAGIGFAISAALISGIGRDRLGPGPSRSGDGLASSLAGVRAALAHLNQRPQARLGIAMIGAQRVGFGIVMVASILAFRNRFNDASDVAGATADLGLWAGLTGAGFVCSVWFAPVLARSLGLRRAGVAVLLGAALALWFPGSLFTEPALLAASALLGLASQTFKVIVDTLVQSHVDDECKGRVFIVYDMVFNSALVLAAVLAAQWLPPDGLDTMTFWLVGAGFACLAAVFVGLGRRIGAESFELGAESLS